MDNLEVELKALIIDSLNLEDVDVKDIDTESPLFVNGLGLDSIDALELGIAIKRKYNVMLNGTSEENQKHFSSVGSLARFINSQKAIHALT